ncbi:FecR family protein [Luteibaculum oceani]|uniref:DUF4974 domain-containing protein n=1 Tax=Luteibaculum oceani TaxID=1294296 RepID=A0A5C6UUC9_9FLAO|nr:FecR domain-containing protein [Luteibaculum oceani]TXC76983.1 DUF4974 domain-containing protein [Luteibaculum oceani]
MSSNHPDNTPSPEEKKLFSKVETRYSRSKEAVWADLEKDLFSNGIETKSKSFIGKVIPLYFRYVAAASVAALIGAFLFMRLSTKVVTTQFAESKTVDLPDGSSVVLNANSKLTYFPYWWNFSRELKLEGEGFFQVKKGKNFEVSSSLGSTRVLGTSFNIFSRNNGYQVYCSTGKVAVKNTQGTEKQITPGELVDIQPGKEIKVKKADEVAVLSWKQNRFSYNTTPLGKVFKDFENYYGVKILVGSKEIYNNYYTGVFSRSLSKEDALTVVCKSFNLKFNTSDNNRFVISSGD